MGMYEIYYDYDNGYTEERNCREIFKGSWDELQDTIKAMRQDESISNISAVAICEESE